MLKFLSQHLIDTNLVEGNFAPPLQRHGDEYIMDALLSRQPSYNAKELRCINRIRIYLQVYSKVCITDRITGKLDRRLLNKTTAWTVRSSLLFLPKHTPKPQDWLIWAKAMTQMFADAGSATGRSSKFGPWVRSHQRWPLYGRSHHHLHLMYGCHRNTGE